jgi:uncharacterized protein
MAGKESGGWYRRSLGIQMKITEGRVRLAASDVANFLACRRLTQLDLLRARGELRPPREFDIGFQELVRRGEVHERAVLERFRADGLDVVEISAAADGTRATAEAIRGGARAVYQGTLTGGGAGHPALFGRPDFLVRADLLPAPDGEPRPDGIHYEVVDAKLARSAKARAVLQTAFYSHLLADLQGTQPRWMHLALGNGEFASFKVSDFAAYERQTRRLLAAAIGGDPTPEVYPEPVEHCAICRWRELCADRRRTDDDLSLVAGMTTGQRRALKGAGIPTRRGFAGRAELPRLDRVSPDALERAQLQARLQVASEDAGVIRYELLDPERDSGGALVANRGLLALPEPADGDLFFDIEGARYYSEDGREFGLQYLFGVVDTAEAGEAGLPRYTQIWAYDRPGEKRAFEELIDFITERRARHPGLHVYHYNHYEPTSVDHLTELHGTRQEAVGRLMGRFATREDEVDDLFRLGVFVDLYRVVRQGARAGVESYSIKRLEPLCGYGRQVDLAEATVNLIALEAALEDGTAAGDGERQRVVAGYNEDDCRATLALRDWLEDRRAELAGRLGEDLPRPVFEAKPGPPEDPEVARIRSALLAGVPAETPLSKTVRTDSERARVLLSDLLDWHRREDKPAWWRYFHVRTLSPAELIGEPDALGGLTGGEVVGQVKKSVVRRFFFPPQEHKFSTDEVACDPDTNKQWTVCEVDDARGTIDLKMGRAYTGPWPTALVEAGPPRTGEQRDRLRDLGDRVARDGVGGGDAATALLLRRPPDDGGGASGGGARGHLPPDRHGVRARTVARSQAADRAEGGSGQPAPAPRRCDDEQRAAGEGAAGRGAGRGRGHELAVGAGGAGGQRGHLVRGRGGAAVAGQRAGGGGGGAEPDPAGRPAAARPAEPRHPSAGRGCLGAGAHPGRPGHDARGCRAAARPDLADAPGPVWVHLGGLLRREAARGRRAGPPGDCGVRVGTAHRRGAPSGEHERLTGRGPRGGSAGGPADRADLAR